MEKLSFAHIINPVIVDKSSDLFIAQPITFETMFRAREFAGFDQEIAGIDLYAAQFQDETHISLPGIFKRTPDLTRSIADIKTFKLKRKLSLIKDILDKLYQSTQADYLIYTNVDIALQPHFYRFVQAAVQQGCDAFVINRRTITDKYTTIAQIPFMYAQIGESHKGYDCFIFKRELYPKFKLGTICIGTAWIGRALLANMCVYASRFREFRDEHLTFHIGDPCTWRNEEFNDYFQENRQQYLNIFKQLENECGNFDPIVHSYLMDTGANRYIPDFNEYYVGNGKCFHQESGIKLKRQSI
ncbi:MAG: hypothetical protein MUF15_01550 [Acidobacteria bacterium]|jgi:hypothetical protein|nr:hypothetical protein [Acidobacteriota bacterium]